MPSAWDEGKCRLVSQREQDARGEVFWTLNPELMKKYFLFRAARRVSFRKIGYNIG
jgi:hypothetical protein